MPQRIHFMSPRWLNQASYTTNEFDLQINKARENKHHKQISKFDSMENMNSTTSRFTKFAKLWSKIRNTSKKNVSTTSIQSPSFISERIHKSHSVSAFFPPSTCNDTTLENIFSPLVDRPMDTIDTIQEEYGRTMAINKKNATQNLIFSTVTFSKKVSDPRLNMMKVR